MLVSKRSNAGELLPSLKIPKCSRQLWMEERGACGPVRAAGVGGGAARPRLTLRVQVSREATKTVTC